MKQKSLLRIFSVLLVAVLVMPLSACQGNRKEEEAYRTTVATTMAQISSASQELNQSIQTFSGTINEDNRKAVLTAVSKLETAYTKLEALKAPSKYTDAQKTISEGAEKALEATAVYKKEFTEVTEKTFNEAFVQRVTAGDKQMEDANAKLLEGSKQCIGDVSSVPQSGGDSQAGTESAS